MKTPPQKSDVVIIGAGPAGSTAAALLAEHGHRVLVLEREKFPRYHIGESLLPFTYQPLERLGPGYSRLRCPPYTVRAVDWMIGRMIRACGADDVAGAFYTGRRLRKLRFLMTDNSSGRKRHLIPNPELPDEPHESNPEAHAGTNQAQHLGKAQCGDARLIQAGKQR
jgi:2-polyprenyl-6-methoxyphenol hydroxylase-like FAD-dependent oxidoreductase